MSRVACVCAGVFFSTLAFVPALPGISVLAQEATPAASCPATTEEENAAIAQRWTDDVINAGDLAVLDDIAANDIIHHAGTFPDRTGVDGVKEVLGALLTGFPDVQQTVEQVITADDLSSPVGRPLVRMKANFRDTRQVANR